MRRREFLKKAGVGLAASPILGPSLVRAQAGPVIRVVGLTAGAVKG
jgi:trehalose/maltose transport system substrate-binding protein